MLRSWLIFLLSTSLFVGCQSEDENKTDTFELIFVGDLLLDRGVRERIKHVGIDDLIGTSIQKEFKKADVVIANLECPVTKIENPINKKFIFRGEPEWLPNLKSFGITHLNMANNHSMDQGRDGLTDTHQNIQNAGMTPMGYGKNTTSACDPIKIADQPVPVYVFSSLQVMSENWVYLEDAPSICEASITELCASISTLKKQQPKAKIIVQLHWGAEHTSQPETFQKQQARQLISAGTDAIIGHHSHTIQTTETIQGKPVFYSIGNFVFDQKKKINSEGLMVKLKFVGYEVEVDTVRVQIDNCAVRM